MESFKKCLIGWVWCFLLSGCVRSCSDSPEAIKYGQDACEHCHMNLSDPRFAAELVTQKGRVYKFDSIGCLLDFSQNQLKEKPKAIYVTDYIPPHNLIDATTENYFDSPEISGPMGPSPIASINLSELQKISTTVKGVMKDWGEISVSQSK